MKNHLPLLAASLLLASLTACSQQQVAGSSQQVAGSSQQVQNTPVTTNDADCRGCNAPKVEPVITPKPVPVVTTRPPVAVTRAAPKPKPRAAYQPRQFVPTVPNKKNASSALVKNIQQALTAKGYNAGGTDGVMGTRTNAALSAFQKANNLPTGINQPTLRALGIK